MLRNTRVAVLYCAAFAATAVAGSTSYAQRNCPSAEDRLVIVQPNQPAPIRLPVANADGSVVTVFQFPLGGELTPTGPGQLDYVFVPDATFSGRTSLTFRVSPPAGCGGGTLIGTVTLAGATAPETVNLGGRIVVTPALCGSGAWAFAALACVGIGLVLHVRRR